MYFYLSNLYNTLWPRTALIFVHEVPQHCPHAGDRMLFVFKDELIIFYYRRDQGKIVNNHDNRQIIIGGFLIFTAIPGRGNRS